MYEINQFNLLGIRNDYFDAWMKMLYWSQNISLSWNNEIGISHFNLSRYCQSFELFHRIIDEYSFRRSSCYYIVRKNISYLYKHITQKYDMIRYDNQNFLFNTVFSFHIWNVQQKEWRITNTGNSIQLGQ